MMAISTPDEARAAQARGEDIGGWSWVLDRLEQDAQTNANWNPDNAPKMDTRSDPYGGTVTYTQMDASPQTGQTYNTFNPDMAKNLDQYTPGSLAYDQAKAYWDAYNQYQGDPNAAYYATVASNQVQAQANPSGFGGNVANAPVFQQGLFGENRTQITPEQAAMVNNQFEARWGSSDPASSPIQDYRNTTQNTGSNTGSTPGSTMPTTPTTNSIDVTQTGNSLFSVPQMPTYTPPNYTTTFPAPPTTQAPTLPNAPTVAYPYFDTYNQWGK